MPYTLMSDTLGRDPRFDTLSGGKLALYDALQAAFMRLQLESASHMLDGYLTHAQALKCCHGREHTLELLSTPVLGGRPFLHRPGETCGEKNCLDASDPWIAGFDFRVCGFSKRNPTRAENDRNKAQNADSKDAPLRAAIYARDGGCCRYCRSGPLKKRGMGRAKDRRRALQFDHTDPDRAAGADGGNYTVACARCNEEKGHRTPAEADMVLLPVPTDSQRDAWAARGEELFDRPADGTDNPRDNPVDNPIDNAVDNLSADVDDVCPNTTPDDEPAGAVRLEAPAQAQQQPPNLSPEGSGSGRVGQPVVSPVPHSPPRPGAQPARTPDAPDIYHRRSRPSVQHPQPPPGGVP